MTQEQDEKDISKYVLLEGLEELNRFYTLNIGDDPTKLEDGTIAYRIIGYANSGDEARKKLFGILASRRLLREATEEENPYILHGDELKKTEDKAKGGQNG